MILISRLFTYTCKRSFRNDDHLHPLSTTSLDALGGEWKGCVKLGVLGFDKRFGVGTSLHFT
jgi:hypothetical protein